MLWDIVQFLKDYNIHVITEGANTQPGWINICCPIPGCNDSNYHGGFNLKKGYYNCWKCGGHNPVYTISKLLSVPVNKAKDIQFEYTGKHSLIQQINKKVTHKSKQILPGKPLSKFHKRYLKKRNFDPEYLEEKYKLLGTGPGEYFAKKNYELRVVIPIISYMGAVVSFQCRDITDKQQVRYKACPLSESVIDIKHTLYNLNNCKGNSVGVLEGVTDVWRFGDNFTATFGTSITDIQLRELLRYDNIFWIFDPEPAAQKKAERAANDLASLGKTIELVQLDDKSRDPAEYKENEVQYIKKELRL